MSIKRKRPLLSASVGPDTLDLLNTISTIYRVPVGRIIDVVFKLSDINKIQEYFDTINKEELNE
jgi:hypothetical protein